jgi:hypothetical protein
MNERSDDFAPRRGVLPILIAVAIVVAVCAAWCLGAGVDFDSLDVHPTIRDGASADGPRRSVDRPPSLAELAAPSSDAEVLSVSATRPHRKLIVRLLGAPSPICEFTVEVVARMTEPARTAKSTEAASTIVVDIETLFIDENPSSSGIVDVVANGGDRYSGRAEYDLANLAHVVEKGGSVAWHVDLEVHGPLYIHGRVRDAAGELSGATVAYFDFSGYGGRDSEGREFPAAASPIANALTDANGEYRMLVTRPKLSKLFVLAMGPRRQPSFWLGDCPATGSLEVPTLPLESSPTVAGHVMLNGKPVADALLSAGAVRYRLRGDGSRSAIFSSFRLRRPRDEAPLNPVRLVLSERDLRLYSPGPYLHEIRGVTAVTRLDGSYVLDDLRAQNYWILLERNFIGDLTLHDDVRDAAQIEVAPPNESADIDIRCATMELSLLAADGRPVEGVEVRLTRHEVTTASRTGKSGRLRFGVMPLTDYEVETKDARFETVSDRVATPNAGETTERTIRLRAK